MNFTFVGDDYTFAYVFKDKFNAPLRVVDYWFGGDDTDNNGIGGKAPKDLEVIAQFKKIK